MEDLQSERAYSGRGALHQAQVANDVFGLELAARLEGTGVSSTVINPGLLVRTDIRRNAGGILWLLEWVLQLFAISPTEAAETPVWLATWSAPSKINGCFFDPHLVEKPVSEERRDPALREVLWQASAELAGLAGGESAPEENAASPYPEPEISEWPDRARRGAQARCRKSRPVVSEVINLHPQPTHSP